MSSVEIKGAVIGAIEEILSAEAMDFVATLCREFRPRVKERLAARVDRQTEFDAGKRPGFLAETAEVRSGTWKVADIPADLRDRRVEITGPVDRKMVINALNSGARVFMADFEDSTAPSWSNVTRGQLNLRDAVARTISFEDTARGKSYALNENPAVLMVRPRGWHLWEENLHVDGEPVPAGLFDFGLYFFHNAKALLDRGTGPYFYLPKMESHLEARLWNDVFVHSQDVLGIPQGSIRGTVLIETLPAAFEMDEILYELRNHSAGLNCGRWDYIFSFIKVHRNDASALLPDRAQIGMTQPFMHAYSRLAIKTCHRRGIHAMGGMAAQIPIRTDEDANAKALAKVRADKQREAQDGHDGTWVAHPGLVPIAMEIFNEHMPDANQIARSHDDIEVAVSDLLEIPTGTRTEQGVRQNAGVGIEYLAAWMGGLGCVPLHNLMEDAATAEISRAQLWQWIRHGATLSDGTPIDSDYVHGIIDQELQKLDKRPGSNYTAARELFEDLITRDTLADFLTLPAYQTLLKSDRD